MSAPRTPTQGIARSILVPFVAAWLILPATASASEAPTAAELTAAVSDHTYQGSMSTAGSTFAEYYAPDGSIRAKGYSGNWRVEDGVMCFQYGSDPERCFEVRLHGPSMEMYKDGELDGNGMLISGNPNEF